MPNKQTFEDADKTILEFIEFIGSYHHMGCSKELQSQLTAIRNVYVKEIENTERCKKFPNMRQRTIESYAAIAGNLYLAQNDPDKASIFLSKLHDESLNFILPYKRAVILRRALCRIAVGCLVLLSLASIVTLGVTVYNLKSLTSLIVLNLLLMEGASQYAIGAAVSKGNHESYRLYSDGWHFDYTKCDLKGFANNLSGFFARVKNNNDEGKIAELPPISHSMS